MTRSICRLCYDLLQLRRAASLSFALGLGVSFAYGAPSFDCSKASKPAELTICSSAELSDLDRLVAQGYAYVKATKGKDAAEAAAAPELRQRYKCGSEKACIESSYLAEIEAFRGLGAPIAPGSARNIAAIQSQPSQDSKRISTRAPLTKAGGTYSVPATINGQITLNFVVDSGASEVSIPADVASTLSRTGTVTGEDFIGTETYVLADGSKFPSPRFYIKSLKVGSAILDRVTAIVTPVGGQLLLGQSFLGRFDSWAIDNRTGALVLNPLSAAEALK